MQDRFSTTERKPSVVCVHANIPLRYPQAREDEEEKIKKTAGKENDTTLGLHN